MTTDTTESVNHRQWFGSAATAQLIGCMFALVAAWASAADAITAAAGPEGPAQTAYAPAKGTGPAVMVLSGQSGPTRYQTFAAELARLGYYSVLLDGNDILTRSQDGGANLRKAIDRAQKSPNAVPGKTAVVGYSLGGGGALRYAAGMPDLVSVVVAYYPYTRAFTNMSSLAKVFRVPILVLAGGRDQYKDCCLIDSMRAMESAAKETGAKFELVVYPDADHGFNHQQDTRNYRRDDASDAWRRTLEMLRMHHPLP